MLDLKGKDNRKLGRYSIIDSAWSRMDIRRFSASIALASAGAPPTFLGSVFYDLPHIFMPSLGLGMFGLTALLHAML